MAADTPNTGELFAQFFAQALPDTDKEPDATEPNPQETDFNRFFGIN